MRRSGVGMGREVRQHVLGDLVEGLGQRPFVAAELQADVVDTGRLHGVQLGQQGVAAAAQPKAPALQRGIGIGHQVQVDEAGIRLVAGHGAPGRHALRMVLWRARVGQAAIHVLADPRRLLLGQACHEQRQGRAIRGQHVQALRQVRSGAFAQQCDLLAEAAAAGVEVAAEQRVLHRAVATGHAQQQAVTAEPLHAARRLQGQQRLADRQHHRTSTQQDVLGDASQIAEVTEYLEHLCRITEGRVVHRHVAHPQRTEAEAVGQACQFCMALQVRFAGQASRGASCLFAQRRPVIVQRCFDADAETTGLQPGHRTAHGLAPQSQAGARPGGSTSRPLRSSAAIAAMSSASRRRSWASRLLARFSRLVEDGMTE